MQGASLEVAFDTPDHVVGSDQVHAFGNAQVGTDLDGLFAKALPILGIAVAERIEPGWAAYLPSAAKTGTAAGGTGLARSN